jgi:hypothetical protein
MDRIGHFLKTLHDLQSRLTQGPAARLAIELAPDDDTLPGLADLGLGCPNRVVSRYVKSSIHLHVSVPIECDIALSTPSPRFFWAGPTSYAGSIRAGQRGSDRLPRDPSAAEWQANPLPPKVGIRSCLSRA